MNGHPKNRNMQSSYTKLGRRSFMRDNALDQLILPKVKEAVADWNSKRSKVPLRSIVFPWLPFVGLRLEDLMNDARRLRA